VTGPPNCGRDTASKRRTALHLAAAIVHGCDRFLTNDTHLNACTDIPIDVLP